MIQNMVKLISRFAFHLLDAVSKKFVDPVSVARNISYCSCKNGNS